MPGEADAMTVQVAFDKPLPDFVFDDFIGWIAPEHAFVTVHGPSGSIDGLPI